MRTPALILSSAVALLGLAAPPAAHAAPRGDWALTPAVRGQYVADASGTDGQFAARYHLLDALVLDLMGRTGYALATDKVGDDVLYVGLGAGVAYAPRRAASDWAPRAGLRLTHIHHATLGSWRDTPGSNLAGDSTGGVRHRSGGEVALGLGAPVFARLGRGWGLAWDLELTGGALPSSEVLDWTVGLGVGLTFLSLGGG